MCRVQAGDLLTQQIKLDPSMEAAAFDLHDATSSSRFGSSFDGVAPALSCKRWASCRVNMQQLHVRRDAPTTDMQTCTRHTTPPKWRRSPSPPGHQGAGCSTLALALHAKVCHKMHAQG